MRGRLGGSAPNSDTRSTMVSSMGSNVGDGKVRDDKVISTAMEVGSCNIGDGKDVVCKGRDVGDNCGMTWGAEVSIDV